MGRRTHSSESNWTPQAAWLFRADMATVWDMSISRLARQIDHAAAELDRLEIVLDDALFDGLSDEQYDRHRELTDDILDRLDELEDGLAETEARASATAGTAPWWLSTSAVDLLTAGPDEVGAGDVVDTRALSALGRVGLVLFETSAGRFMPEAPVLGQGSGDVSIDGVKVSRSAVLDAGFAGDTDRQVGVMDVEMLTRDRRVRRAYAVAGRRPWAVAVGSVAVPIGPYSIVDEAARGTIRVLVRLAHEAERGTSLVRENVELSERWKPLSSAVPKRFASPPFVTTLSAA